MQNVLDSFDIVQRPTEDPTPFLVQIKEMLKKCGVLQGSSSPQSPSKKRSAEALEMSTKRQATSATQIDFSPSAPSSSSTHPHYTFQPFTKDRDEFAFPPFLRPMNPVTSHPQRPFTPFPVQYPFTPTHSHSYHSSRFYRPTNTYNSYFHPFPAPHVPQYIPSMPNAQELDYQDFSQVPNAGFQIQATQFDSFPDTTSRYTTENSLDLPQSASPMKGFYSRYPERVHAEGFCETRRYHEPMNSRMQNLT